MSELIHIAGAKGGGGKGGGGGTARAAVEAPDSLRSRAMARVLDLWGEGEIEGPVGEGLTWVYLNETQVENADGTFNFTGVTIEVRNGTQSQEYISNFPGVENELPVAVEVTNDTPLVRTISNNNVNAVRVTVGIPQLSQQNVSTGDLNGSSVTLAIDVQTDDGGYVERLVDTITGKTMTRYQKSYVIQLPPGSARDVMIRRVTEDSTSAALVDRTWWDSYTEIIDAKLRYPNSALGALMVDSQQFDNIPNRAYRLRLLRIRVPSNYDPLTRTYTGSWDGTFKIAWSNNPAWCFYELATNERFGLGGYLSQNQVDKWVLYSIGRYCDVLVHDGFGGMEPRFTCNLYQQTREDAFKVMQDLASIFRAMIYWAGGAITAVQDAPADAVQLFTNGNVIDGKFTYAGSSQKQRATVALVRWNDPADFYRQKVEYVEDKAGIERYGINEKEIIAVGCTSRGQAHRVGRWLLYSEIYETETVTFRTSIEGAVSRPGQIIKVQDNDRANVSRGGRIHSATIDSITLDRDVTLDPGVNTIHVALPNGTVASRSVLGLVGRVLTVADNFPHLPAAQAIWILSSATLAAQTFRVIAVLETPERDYEISALQHNPDKYDAIEDNLTLETPVISNLTAIPVPPAVLHVDETLYSAAQDFKVLITASWPPVPGATEYEVSYSRDNNNMIPLPRSRSPIVEIRDAQPGMYKFRCVTVNALGRKSSAITAEKQIFGKTAPPADVITFLLQGTTLSWIHVSDIDVAGYRIKFQPGTSFSWENAVEMHAGIITDSPYDMAIIPSGQNTIMIKAVDTSGNESLNPAYIVVNLGDPDVANIVEIFDRAAADWPGTLTGGTIDGLNHLVADNLTLMWNVDPLAAMWSASGTTDMWSTSIYKQMTYEDQIVVSEALAGSRMTINRTILGDPWSIQYRENGPSLMWDLDGSLPMWGSDDSESAWDLPPYQPWPGEIIAKNTAYDFFITTGQGQTHGIIGDFSIVVDAPDIEEFLDDIAVAPGGTRLPITKDFRVIKNIQLTVQGDGGSAVTARYLDKNVELGPLTEALSATAISVAGILDARIKGY